MELFVNDYIDFSGMFEKIIKIEKDNLELDQYEAEQYGNVLKFIEDIKKGML